MSNLLYSPEFYICVYVLLRKAFVRADAAGFNDKVIQEVACSRTWEGWYQCNLSFVTCQCRYRHQQSCTFLPSDCRELTFRCMYKTGYVDDTVIVKTFV